MATLREAAIEAAYSYQSLIDQAYEDAIGELMMRFSVTRLEAEAAFEEGF